MKPTCRPGREPRSLRVPHSRRRPDLDAAVRQGLARYGQVNGIPTAPGTYPFTVRVIDSQSPTGSATKQLQIRVNGVLAVRKNSIDEFDQYR
jgi:hypothetical protein